MSAEAEPFDDPAAAKDADILGMWVFLVTELLLFGGLFGVYAAYRWMHPDSFTRGAAHLDAVLGSLNTAVLLTSSLFVALGVEAAAHGRGRASAGWLLATVALGLAFLGIKAVEWTHKAHAGLFPGRFGDLPPADQLFFNLYYTMTGLHAAHVALGAALLLWAAFRARTHTAVELTGLYWHFVDVVWIFLFPLLYLIPGGPP